MNNGPPQPDPHDVAPKPDRLARFRGAVVGAAIGDAMGHPTEFMSMQEIHQTYGAAGVRSFELWWERNGKRFAPYTDDTQMAEVVLVSLTQARQQSLSLDEAMVRMAAGFVNWLETPQGGHRAPGNACLTGCRAIANGKPWHEAGGAKAGGCGSVMRAYAFGLLFADDEAQAEHWAVQHSKITHGDPIALAACAAMAVGMARNVRAASSDEVLTGMIAAAARHCKKTGEMIEGAMIEALAGSEPAVIFAQLQGWAAHEAIAAAAYVFCRHADDPEAAILEGANTPGDSGSIATLAGALVGARCGVDALPPKWVQDVERGAELLALADAAFAVSAVER